MTAQTYSLRSGASHLTIDSDGQLLALDHAGRQWLAAPGWLWRMSVQAPSDASVLGRHRPVTVIAAPRIEATADRLTLRYPALAVEGESLPVDLTVTITAIDDEFEFRFAVTNHSPDWQVRELVGPCLTADLSATRPALLWPNGAGERLPEPDRVGLRQLAYPTRLFMPWLALAGDSDGLYLGAHDDSLRTMQLTSDGRGPGGSTRLEITSYPFCAGGAEWHSPPLVVRPYAGTWHAAADRYRRWAESWWRPEPAPAWVAEINGCQLVILKQQNGEIHWPYADLDRLIELGQESGFNLLALYGWTTGGHDRHYPTYEPDPAMGGEAALRAGIARAQAAGQRVILYTNGQLLDLQSTWFAAHGRAVVTLSERGEVFGENWQKYHDAPARPMGYGCQSAPAWSDCLLALAHQAHDLGADGIIYDQVGSAHPRFCFATDHGHGDPAAATGPGAAANVRRVQAAMAAIDPEFIVMVEHVTDQINQAVDLTHGCGVGFAPGATSFPALLRYTFPEIRATQRHPSPTMPRDLANWCCLYGFIGEVEYRYWPDRRYIDQGHRPTLADYERICNPPDVAMIQRVDPREAHGYLRQVTALVGRHADLLRAGRFTDTLGFTCDNPAVEARSYRAGNLLAVVVWNPTAEPQTVRIEVAGGRLTAIDAPEGSPADPATPLPASSLRLLRFELAP